MLASALFCATNLGAANVGAANVGAASEAITTGCTQPQAILRADRTVAVDASLPVVSAVTLPDTLDKALLRDAVALRYRLVFGTCATEAFALHIFRAGAPYIVATADGQQLKSLMDPEHAGAQFNGRVPALFAVPAGTQAVDVVFQTKPHLFLGLLDVSVGPTSVMLPLEAQAVRAVVGYGRFGAAVLLVFGLLGLLLWLQRRSRASLFWLALGCILWGVRGGIYFSSDLPLPARWFELLNPLMVLGTSICVALTCLRMLPAPAPRAARCFAVVAVLASALFMVAGMGGPGMALSIGGCLLVGYFILLWLLWWLWSHRAGLQPMRWAALTVSVLAMVLAGAHDVLMLYRVVPSTDPYALFWGFTVLLMVCVALSSSYLLRSLSLAEGANEQLAQTIRSKTVQLEASYALLGQRERDAARTQERAHLLREMHDGIGAQLVTALRGMERGALAPQQVVKSLQDSLDELRMLMDSIDVSAYLPSALAAWRSRWDAKLAAAGVTLGWHIDDSLDAVTLSGDVTLQVMRILQEAAANVVKHSNAQRMSLSANVVTTNGKKILSIDITDDGVGLSPDAARVGARGLKNMHHRASEMGARLTVSSTEASSSGCRVLLELPID